MRFKPFFFLYIYLYSLDCKTALRLIYLLKIAFQMPATRLSDAPSIFITKPCELLMIRERILSP